MMLVLPLESSEFVMKNAKHVKICQEGIEMLGRMVLGSLQDKQCKYFSYKSSDLNPKEMNDDAIDWVFLTHVMNFSFWSLSKEESAQVSYKNKSYSGQLALNAALRRAIEDGYPLTDARYYLNISEKDLRHILRSDNAAEIPLFEKRFASLKETGSLLVEKFDGSFVNCVRLANKSALKLLEIIVENFPSFRDEATYMGKKVTFYKRAQVLVADIWSCFEGKGLGTFDDIDQISMFADYRVPQVLRYYKAIDYSAELTEVLKSNTLMHTGDALEVEIRAASIVACNLITKHVRHLISKDQLQQVAVNDCAVDKFLWHFRRDNAAAIEAFLPCHKIRCTFY